MAAAHRKDCKTKSPSVTVLDAPSFDSVQRSIKRVQAEVDQGHPARGWFTLPDIAEKIKYQYTYIYKIVIKAYNDGSIQRRMYLKEQDNGSFRSFPHYLLSEVQDLFSPPVYDWYTVRDIAQKFKFSHSHTRDLVHGLRESGRIQRRFYHVHRSGRNTCASHYKYSELKKFLVEDRKVPKGYLTTTQIANQYGYSETYIRNRLFDLFSSNRITRIDRCTENNKNTSRYLYKKTEIDKYFSKTIHEEDSPPVEWFNVSQMMIIFNKSRNTINRKLKANKKAKPRSYWSKVSNQYVNYYDMRIVRDLF